MYSHSIIAWAVLYDIQGSQQGELAGDSRDQQYVRAFWVYPYGFTMHTNVQQNLQADNKSSKSRSSDVNYIYLLLKLDAAAAKYGFEAALVMCGNTINKDICITCFHAHNYYNKQYKSRTLWGARS